MKKILTVLLAAAMCIVAPSAIFADTETEYEFTPATDSTETSGNVELKADIVSTYTVKLPKVINVAEDNKTVDILAKGDVDGSKKIVISESNAGNNTLNDLSNKNTAVALSISFGTGIEGKNIEATYGNAKDTMTISHGALKAGAWKCTLPILIKLQDITPAN